MYSENKIKKKIDSIRPCYKNIIAGEYISSVFAQNHYKNFAMTNAYGGIFTMTYAQYRAEFY